MVGENNEIPLSQTAKMLLNYPPWFEKVLQFARYSWLKKHLILSVHHGWKKC